MYRLTSFDSQRTTHKWMVAIYIKVFSDAVLYGIGAQGRVFFLPYSTSLGAQRVNCPLMLLILLSSLNYEWRFALSYTHTCRYTHMNYCNDVCPTYIAQHKSLPLFVCLFWIILFSAILSLLYHESTFSYTPTLPYGISLVFLSQ